MTDQPDRDAGSTPPPSAARLIPPTRAVERSHFAASYETTTDFSPEDSRIRRSSVAEAPSSSNTAAPATLQPVSPTDSAVTSGFGTPPETPIATLPPIVESIAGWPISKNTGEPRRSGLVVTICALLIVSALVAAGSYWWYWWNAINIKNFGSSSWLISWFDPRPGSGWSILLVTLMAVVGIVMTAMPGMAAYNAWEGAGWSRRAGLIAAISGLGAVFVGPIAWIGFALSAIGFGLMWLPGFKAWLVAWAAAKPAEAPEIIPPSELPYGPEPRFR